MFNNTTLNVHSKSVTLLLTANNALQLHSLALRSLHIPQRHINTRRRPHVDSHLNRAERVGMLVDEALIDAGHTRPMLLLVVRVRLVLMVLVQVRLVRLVLMMVVSGVLTDGLY